MKTKFACAGRALRSGGGGGGNGGDAEVLPIQLKKGLPEQSDVVVVVERNSFACEYTNRTRRIKKNQE